MELRDKVTVITGGASGIGAASCRAFAAEGAWVVVADRDGDGARRVAGEIGGHAVACDVRQEKNIQALVEETRRTYGPVDVFFSNAGLIGGGDPLDTSPDVWQLQWDVHVMAHVWAARAVLPSMLERGSGYLIHTASMAGILTSHGACAYAVTKHAAVGLAEWLSITYHDRGVRTSLLAPLGVRTPLLGDPDSPFARLAAGPIREPEDVARMVVEAVREERFLILTDPIAQKWIEQKAQEPERWLRGMRRLQARLEQESG